MGKPFVSWPEWDKLRATIPNDGWFIIGGDLVDKGCPLRIDDHVNVEEEIQIFHAGERFFDVIYCPPVMIDDETYAFINGWMYDPTDGFALIISRKKITV